MSLLKSSSKVLAQTIKLYLYFRNQGRIVKEEVKPHPVLSRLYRGSQQQTLTFDSNLVPMLCPPQPWCSTKSGGYLLAKSDLIRLPQQAMQQLDRIEKANMQVILNIWIH